MKGLTSFEQAVLDMLLTGDHQALVTLRAQAEMAQLSNREYTGVGFFCSFDVPPDAPIVTEQGNFQIGDVHGELEGLEHGAGFVLFMRGGRLDTLEGFSYEEPWPPAVNHFTLTYLDEPRKFQIPDVSDI